MSFTKANPDLLGSSQCLGADVLMKLLGNYCRNKDVKTVIRVGVVGRLTLIIGLDKQNLSVTPKTN